jgi:hypothetical protein
MNSHLKRGRQATYFLRRLSLQRPWRPRQAMLPPVAGSSHFSIKDGGKEGKTIDGAKEGQMLSKKRCRHTGVVNFFADDPHLPVGSAIKVGRRVGYHWRCYTDPCSAAGAAPSLKSAEREIAGLCRKATQARRQARAPLAH